MGVSAQEEFGGCVGRNIKGAFVGFQECGQTPGFLPGHQYAGIKRDGHL
jgi:hypothetical protein